MNIGDALEKLTVNKEIINEYSTAVRTHWVFFQIIGIPYRMFIVELENIGVHAENEQIAANLKFGFKRSALGVHG
jgi:hypothetical protein